MAFTGGKLLIAPPNLGDPNFDRAVVFMVEHNNSGAHGLVLNNPTAAELDDVLPDWAALAAPPARFFIGGPVSPESVICVGAFADRQESDALLGNVHPVDLNVSLQDLDGRLEHVRAFVGYCGWAPLQLEAELAADAWFVVDAQPHDLFSAEPLLLWETVLRRQPGPLSWLAGYPDDPRSN